MDINLSMSAAPAITVNKLVVAVYEESAPNVLVQSQVFNAPHAAPRNITFANLNPVVHRVVIYESVDGSASGTIRHQFIYDPSFESVLIREDWYLTVNSTPNLVSQTKVYTNPDLEGWIFDIERRGFGTMYPLGEDYTFDTIDTITLAANTPEFEDEEKFIFRFQPKITLQTVIANSLSGLGVVDTKIVTDTETLLAADINKVISIQGVPDNFIMTLPLLADVPSNRMMPVLAEGGNHINVIIRAQAADTIQWMKQALSEIIIAQSEIIWLYKFGGKWNVANAEGNFKSVGQLVHSYLATEMNTLFCDGAVYSRASYPRLWKYITSLDASELVNDANWNNVALNNKARFSSGDGVTTFRVPLLHTPGFLKCVDGITRKAGSWADSSLGEHDHFMFNETDDGGANYSSRSHSTGGNLGYSINGSSQIPNVKKTSKAGAGTDTSPKTTGIYLLIKF